MMGRCAVQAVVGEELSGESWRMERSGPTQRVLSWPAARGKQVGGDEAATGAL